MAKMMIGGEPAESTSAEWFEVRNPATGEVVETVQKGTVEDVQRAVAAAEKALPEWSALASSRRGEILHKAVHLIQEHESELAKLLTEEQGKPLSESVRELRRFAHTLEHYAGLAKTIRGGHIPRLDEGKYGLILKRPIGICGAIVPWNFPVSLLGNKLGPALLAGNAVIVKPASTSPLTDIRCIELLCEAGITPGALNIVTGPGGTVGEEILRHPAIRKIGFTGETRTGKHVMEVAAREIKRVTLELGGSDPMIVADDADLEAAVSAAAVGRFYNCGQACLAIKRLYLFERIHDDFVSKLVEKVKRLKVGNGLEAETRLGPLHTAAQREEVEEQVAEAVKRGGKVLAGGKRPEGREYEKGFFYLPTLLSDVPDEARIVQEECFGPALPIFKVKDWEEAIARANHSIYGLGSSVWSRDLARAMAAAERIESGYTWINSAQIIYDELPFGGVKWSGLGKEHGSEALDYYMETKSVVVGKT